MRIMRRADLFRACTNSLRRALVIGSALGVGAAGAAAQTTPREYEVRAPSTKANPFASYKFRYPDVADFLNTSLAPLIWADEACDWREYTARLRMAREKLVQATKDLRLAHNPDDATRDLATLDRILVELPSDDSFDTLAKRWRSRHCGFLLKDDLAYDPEPRFTLETRVPCPVPTSASGPRALRCLRKAKFYSRAIKEAAEAALPAVDAAFRDCAAPNDAQPLTAALTRLRKAFETVAPTYQAGVALRKSLVNDYALERRQGLIEHMLIADRAAAGSLAADFHVIKRLRTCVRTAGR